MAWPRSDRWGFLASPWVAPLLGVLCFANGLRNGFVYDDVSIIRDNPRIRSLAFLPEIWLSDWWKPYGEEAEEPFQRRDRLYRPLTLASFAVEYAVHRGAAVGYHATNVLLHALACLLVWHFAQRLFGDRALSGWAAAVFAVHPVHCEAVTGLVGRAEVLAAVFLLGGLVVLLRPERTAGWRRTAAAAGLFVAALMCKETAVCYPALALLVLWGRDGAVLAPEGASRGRDGALRQGDGARGRTLRCWVLRTATLLLPLLVYLPLRYVALEHHLIRDRSPSFLFNPVVAADMPERVLLPLTIVGHYARLLLVPAQLSSDYGLATIPLVDVPVNMTLLGAVATIAVMAALLGLQRRDAPVWGRLGLLAAMSLASYALISNTVLLIGVSLAERLMYWPSVPLLLLGCVAALAAWRRLRAAGAKYSRVAGLLRVGGLLVVAALGLRSVDRNLDWRDNLRLYEADVRTFPQDANLNGNLGLELLNRARDEQDPDRRYQLIRAADGYLARTLEIHPPHAAAMALRGEARLLLGDAAGATAFLDSAVRYDPTDAIAKRLLDRLRGSAEVEERIAELSQQVADDPSNVATRLELGVLLRGRGRHAEAVEQFERAAELEPDNLEALRLLGQSLAAYEERARAIAVFRRVLERAPDDWETHANLAAVLGGDDPRGALRHAREAYRLQPTALETNQNLAEALAVNGLIDDAIRQYRLVERGLPAGDPMRAAVSQRIAQLQRDRR